MCIKLDIYFQFINSQSENSKWKERNFKYLNYYLKYLPSSKRYVYLICRLIYAKY